MGQNISLSFDISGEADVLTRPKLLTIRNPGETQSNQPFEGLKYQADILAGLNLYWLCLPETAGLNANLSAALSLMDPHHSLHHSAKERIGMWQKKKPGSLSSINIASPIAEVLNDATRENGLDLSKLLGLIPIFEKIESHHRRPLLFNFELELTPDILNSLHLLTNLLFYVRALVMSDYNHQLQDPTFESIRMDSVHDYLPKLESIAHDAAIYSHFRRLEAQMPTLVAQRLKEVFHNYTSMGVTLIDSIERIRPSHSFGKDLSQNLQRIQMDWLFGTTSGICHRLREELLAIRDGYHNVFHLDIPNDFRQLNSFWSFDCLIDNSSIEHSSVA